MQIQSSGTKTGQHHGEAIRENELRGICRCVEIGFEHLSKRGNSGLCTDVFKKNLVDIKGFSYPELKVFIYCVTSIYAAWHIGIASSSKFVASASLSSSVVVVVCRRHTLYSGQYLKNGLSDLIQIWHMDVTGPGGVLYSFVTLNSH